MVKEKELVKILLHDTWGFNNTIYPLVDKMIGDVRPSYYDFGNPGSFHIFFKPDFNSLTIEQLISDLKGLCGSHRDILENTSLSKCSAVFTYETDFFGGIKAAPMGGSEIHGKGNIIWSLS